MIVNDREILELIKQGKDNAALSIIYQAILPKIKRYILQNSGTEDEFKDIFQDTIIIFYRKVKTGEFRQDGSIEAFIVTVAKNLYINHVNRHVKRNVRMEVSDKSDDKEDIIQHMIIKEKEILIERAFAELGEVCNELLKLSVYGNFNMKEIAAKMGFANEDVAKTKNYKCKQRLAELMKNNKGLYNFFKP